MLITTLAEYPNYRDQSIKLIENSFGYDEHNKFEVDFYPLIQSQNLNNCYVVIKNKKVIAHIGLQKRSIKVNNQNFNLNLYGGIAVAKSARGKGVFKQLFTYVLEKNKDCALHLLWSEKIQMYNKFNFYPAISQFEYPLIDKKNSDYEKVVLKDLSLQDKEKIQYIYNNSIEFRINRSREDWILLEKVSSTDLYIKKEKGEVQNYFFINKGADLQGIVHEYGIFNKQSLKEFQTYGKVWSGILLNDDNPTSLYSSLVKIGTNFSNFINCITEQKINVLNFDNEGVDFCFNNQDYFLPIPEFLTGILGPGNFEELGELKPLYICGLDSI